MLHIDVEDAHGFRLGPGPIITGTGWTQTDRLNAAGEFAFSLPALDPRARLLRAKRWVRAWECTTPGGWQEVGYGRLERFGLTVGPDGAPMLQVSGVNELGALADRICHNLALSTHARRHPVHVILHGRPDHEGTLTLDHVTDRQPGDLTTTDSVDVWEGEDLTVGSVQTFDRITILLGAGSEYVNILTAKYYDAEQAAWVDLDITDGTLGWPWGDHAWSLNTSGHIDFEPPENWGVTPGKVTYEIRLTVTGSGSDARTVILSDVSVWAWEPLPDPVGAIMAYAPDGWGLDLANGYSGVQDAPLGTAVHTNGSFETFTGTADDDATDAFTGWTNAGTGAAARIEAVTDAIADTYAVKLVSVSARAQIYQAVTVTAGQEYTVTFWTKGDGGAGQATYAIYAGTYGDPLAQALTCWTDTGITAATWTRIRQTFVVPAGFATATLLFSTPGTMGAAAYIDAASVRPGGADKVYLDLADESVLEALRRIAEATNENFIRSPAGLKVLWLGDDVRHSGLRAIAAQPDAGASAPNTLLLQNLTEQTDAAGLVTRLYPYGGGMGAERVTLADVTQVADGYTINAAANYIERDAAVAALGIIEQVQSWPDIIPADKSLTQRQYASNALLWQAVQYLTTHSATDTDPVHGDLPRFWSAQVVKAERIILPGYQVRLDYHQYRDGEHAINIDLDVWITAATQAVGANGLYTVALELATVPRAAERNDDAMIARGLIRLKNIVAHTTAQGNNGAPALVSAGNVAGVLSMTTLPPIISALSAGAAQYQVPVTGATPFAPAWSGFLLSGTTGGRTDLAVTTGKVLTLTATDDFNLTVPATGVAALLNQANSFTLINPLTTIAESWIGPSATAGIYFKAGLVGLGTAAPTAKLTISVSSVAPAALPFNGSLHLWGDDSSTVGGMLSDTFGTYSFFAGRAAGGTAAAPTATPANLTLIAMLGFGRSTNAYVAGSKAWISMLSGELWTDTANGTYMTFATTENGTTARTERMRIAGTGYVGIGMTVPTTLLHVVSTTAATDAVRNVLTLGANVTDAGVGAAGLGPAIAFTAESSTTADVQLARIAALWNEATHASRKATLNLYVSDSGGERTALALVATGTGSYVQANGDLLATGDIKASGVGVNGLVLWDTVLAAYYRLTLTNGVLIITAV